jgi:subtilase family serine protease
MHDLFAARGRKAVFNPSLMSRVGLPLLAMSAALAMPAAHAGSWVNTATLGMPSRNITLPSALAASTPLRITVALQLQNKAQLDEFAKAVSTPGNAQFGKFLTPAQFKQQYAPSAAQVETVVEYLKNNGFRNVVVSDNNMAISAIGTAVIAEKAFNTSLVQFRLGGAVEFANTSVAQVPASLGGVVASVIGLQSTGHMHTTIKHHDASKQQLIPAGVRSAAHTSAGDGVPEILPTFTASMIRTAYDADSVPTGQGTSVGIIAWGDVSGVPSDLLAYETLNNLPQVPFSNVIVGEPGTTTSGLDEWDLDSQSSSAIATNLRQIVMYSVFEGEDADLAMGAAKVVSDDAVKAVNMSFGGCEEISFLDGSMLSMDQSFEQGVAEGMTFFAAAGDGGASCQLFINAGQPVGLGLVEYPGSSPWVITSGGTSLLINSDGSYDTEISWISGGGGVSLFEPAQSWQQPVLPPLSFALGTIDPDLGIGFQSRSLPDVAMNGDDLLSPFNIVVKGASEGVGGTSESSPLSMGTFARFQAAHGECYGFPGQMYYATVPPNGPLASVATTVDGIVDTVLSLAVPLPLAPLEPGLGEPAAGFHDITVGFNFLYPATPGWDYTTGLGSFDVAAVNAELPSVSCAPEVPFKLAASTDNGQLLLNWGISPGATSYAIYQGTASGKETSKPFAISSSPSIALNDLAGSHFFTVQAINGEGVSPISNEVSVNIPVAVPGGLSATVTGIHDASLQWTGTDNANEYYVFYGTTPGGETTRSKPATGTSITLTGLKANTTYYFVVEGYNRATAQFSAPSNEVSATTPK